MTASSGKRQQPLQAPWEVTPEHAPESARIVHPASPQPPRLPAVTEDVAAAPLHPAVVPPPPEPPPDAPQPEPQPPVTTAVPLPWAASLLRFMLCLLGGFVGGVYYASEASHALQERLATAEHALAVSRQQQQALEQAVHDKVGFSGQGQLKNADRNRHELAGRRYALTLRRTQAQGAAELMAWFINRWDQLLDFPQADDRIGRRAATLALLVGGMAENLNEGDFVPWQAEFLNGDWLGELHFDMNGDGLPGKRNAANTHDGFANVSICHIAMALNQAMLDGRVLMMPNMRCDRPEARMSIFLQGKTFDQALDVFVKQVREQGFLVVEKYEGKLRLVLVGARRRVLASP